MGSSKGKSRKGKGEKRDKTFGGMGDTAREVADVNGTVPERVLQSAEQPSKFPKKVRGSARESYHPYHKK